MRGATMKITVVTVHFWTAYRREGCLELQLHSFLTSVLICNTNSDMFVGGKFCITKLGFIPSAKDTFLKKKFRCYEKTSFP